MDAFETRRTVLCLGAPRVDLVSAHPVREADSFVPRVGGAVASVALVAARAGAPVALAGSVGDDEWGTWLRSRLSDAGMDTASLAAAGPSRIAFVTARETRSVSFVAMTPPSSSAAGGMSPPCF